MSDQAREALRKFYALNGGVINPYEDEFAREVQVIDDALAQARREEREACAKVAEDEKVDADDTNEPTDYSYNQACRDVARAIRQREGA